VKRTNGGKTVISISIKRNGKPVDVLLLTSSTSGRSQAAKAILAHAGPTHEIEIAEAIAKLLVDAEEKLKAGPVAGSQTIRDIIHELVPEDFRFTHRGEKGLWSEARGCEIQRSDFLAYTPDKVIRVCMVGIDCPRGDGGIVNEPDLLHRIEVAMKIVWATLCDTLPARASDAGLAANTADAQRFKATLVQAWNALSMNESIVITPKGSAPFPSHRKASLASRVRTDLAGGKYPRDKWLEIQPAYAAWWRPVMLHGDNGKITVLLAMKFELFGQLRIKPPGVDDQTSLRALGIRYGAFLSDTPVTDKGKRVTDKASGGTRLVVLSPEITEIILSQPAQNDEDVRASDAKGAQ
jgi:hypothetical protein